MCLYEIWLIQKCLRLWDSEFKLEPTSSIAQACRISRIAALAAMTCILACASRTTKAGRYDGFFETGLKPWDIAAGCLLITEAGGLVGDLQGNDSYLKSGHLCAGNPKVFAQMLQVIAPHLTDELKSVNA